MTPGRPAKAPQGPHTMPTGRQQDHNGLQKEKEKTTENLNAVKREHGKRRRVRCGFNGKATRLNLSMKKTSALLGNDRLLIKASDLADSEPLFERPQKAVTYHETSELLQK